MAEQRSSGRKFSYADPVVIGAGSFIVGYIVGSGKFDTLGKMISRIAGDLGNLTAILATSSLKEHNPRLFREEERVTH